MAMMVGQGGEPRTVRRRRGDARGDTAESEARVRYSTVGGPGLKVSAVGLGCDDFGMRIDADEADRVVGAALDAGVTVGAASAAQAQAQVNAAAVVELSGEELRGGGRAIAGPVAETAEG